MASDVTIDLCQKTLRQANTTGRCTGIYVVHGVSNVKIFNGSIKNFSQLGIQVDGDVDGLILGDDETFLYTTGNGYGSTYDYKDNLTDEPIFQGGIRLNLTRFNSSKGFGPYYGLLSNVRMTNVISEENFPLGMLLGNVDSFYAEKCSFSKNESKRMCGLDDGFGEAIFADTYCTAGVFHLSNLYTQDEGVNSAQFISCNFDEQIVRPDPNDPFGRLSQDVFGAVFGYVTTNINFLDCTFSKNRGEPLGDSSFALGTWPFAGGGCKNISFEGCKFIDNFSTFHIENHISAYSTLPNNGAFVTPSDAPIWKDCVFTRNLVQTQGFEVVPGMNLISMYYAKSVRIEDVTITDNSAMMADDDLQTTPGSCYGIFITGTAGDFPGDNGIESITGRDSLITGCNISNNVTNSQAAAARANAISAQTSFHNIEISNNYLANPKLTTELGLREENGVYIAQSFSALVTVGGIDYPASFTTASLASSYPFVPVVAPAQVITPSDGCSSVGDVTGLIGIVEFVQGLCFSADIVANVADANAVAVLIISFNEDPTNYAGSASVNIPQIVVSKSAGTAILAYLADNPQASITLTVDTNSSITNVLVQNNAFQGFRTAAIHDVTGQNDVIDSNTIQDCCTGILFDVHAFLNSAKNNYISRVAVGIQDLATESNNLVMSNQVWNSNTGIDVTYPSGPAPVQVGSLTTGFPSDLKIFENLSMNEGAEIMCDGTTDVATPSKTAPRKPNTKALQKAIKDGKLLKDEKTGKLILVKSTRPKRGILRAPQ